METFNKLVRDNIPQIIEKNGQKANLRTLNDEEYLSALNNKLLEEVDEYLIDQNAEEIADVLEVVDAILAHMNISQEEIAKIKEEKAKKNGKFDKNFYLLAWRVNK